MLGRRLFATEPGFWERWDGFAAGATSSIFQTSAFLEPLYRILAPIHRAEPVLIAVEDGAGRPLLLAPLALVRRGALRVVELADFGFVDLASPVFDSEGVAAVGAEAVRQAVREALPPHDILHLSKMPADVGGQPNPFAAWPGARPMSLVTMAYDPAGGSLSDLPAVKECERKFRKIEREGGAVRLVTDGERGVALCAAIDRMRAERALREGAENSLAPEPVRLFYADVVRRAAAAGRLSAVEVLLGERLIAAVIGFHHQNRFHGTLMGVDVDDATRVYSPGALAVTAALRAHLDRDGGLFDLGMGDSPYKSRFGAVPRPLLEIRAVRSLKGLGPVVAERAVDEARAYLRAHPALKRRINRLLGRAA